jgi:hypothetical protein
MASCTIKFVGSSQACPQPQSTAELQGGLSLVVVLELYCPSFQVALPGLVSACWGRIHCCQDCSWVWGGFQDAGDLAPYKACV